MKNNLLIRQAAIVNEGNTFIGDVLIEDCVITKIGDIKQGAKIHTIDARGKFLLPGIIDAQVHFRQPGLTHKGDIFTETKAAIAGGVTSCMEMPNTIPNALTLDILENNMPLQRKDHGTIILFFLE